MAHTSQAGSLSAKFSEKLKIAGVKASGGDFKELNVAVIKATTNQFHVVPKEKHVRTLKLAVHPGRPRRDIVHVISELHNRLQDATDWLTALKSLITLHRLMRESEPGFLDELVRYSEAQAHTTRGASGGATGAAAAAGAPASRLFAMDNFIDKTTAEGRFDFSEWVRAYGKYLDEQLSLYASLRWYVEQEAPGHESRMRSLGARDLLFQLPHLQRLQRRLLDCVPRGAATHDPVVLFALGLVVKESFKVYKAVSEGVINLADAFFEMEYHDAAKGLELYKESMAASDALSGYYATIEQIDEIKRSMQLPKLSSPPPDFLASMEAYVAEAPRPVAADGEAPAPTKRGVPLRKGRLLATTGSGGRTGVPVPSGSGAPRDPGMVLPVPSASVDSGKAGSAVSSPTVAGGTSQSTAAVLLDGESATSPAAAAAGEAATAAEPAAPPKPAPSPLDLLSDLDFSFGAPAEPAAAAGAAAPPPAANPFANPFADVPAAPAAAPAPAPAVGSSNPFGDAPAAAAPAAAAPAAAAFASGFDWPAPAAPAPAAAVQPGWHQPQYGLQQPQTQAPQQGYYGAVASDDPFAGFGAPSPAAAPSYGGPPAYGAAPAAAYGQAARSAAPPAGGLWGSPASPTLPSYSGGVPIPTQPSPGAAAAEMSRAALHDPFAALTGLPPKSSPGSTGARPSPPRYYPGY